MGRSPPWLLALCALFVVAGCAPAPPRESGGATTAANEELVIHALKTIGSLRHEVDSLLPERARLTEETVRLQATIDDQHKLLAALNRERDTLLERIARLESDNQLLKESQKKLESTLNGSLAELAELRFVNERLRGGDQTRTYKALREQNAWLSKKLEEFRYHVLREQSNVAALHEDLAEALRQQESMRDGLAAPAVPDGSSAADDGEEEEEGEDAHARPAAEPPPPAVARAESSGDRDARLYAIGGFVIGAVVFMFLGAVILAFFVVRVARSLRAVDGEPRRVERREHPTAGAASAPAVSAAASALPSEPDGASASAVEQATDADGGEEAGDDGDAAPEAGPETGELPTLDILLKDIRRSAPEKPVERALPEETPEAEGEPSLTTAGPDPAAIEEAAEPDAASDLDRILDEVFTPHAMGDTGGEPAIEHVPTVIPVLEVDDVVVPLSSAMHEAGKASAAANRDSARSIGEDFLNTQQIPPWEEGAAKAPTVPATRQVEDVGETEVLVERKPCRAGAVQDAPSRAAGIATMDSVSTQQIPDLGQAEPRRSAAQDASAEAADGDGGDPLSTQPIHTVSGAAPRGGGAGTSTERELLKELEDLLRQSSQDIG